MAEYIEKWSVVNRLIDIENEFQQYKPFRGYEHAMYRKICEAEIAIGKAQAADVAPVQHGRWIDKGEYAVCMECGGRSGTQYDGVEPIPLMTQFCPNCGAKMDEEVSE